MPEAAARTPGRCGQVRDHLTRPPSASPRPPLRPNRDGDQARVPEQDRDHDGGERERGPAAGNPAGGEREQVGGEQRDGGQGDGADRQPGGQRAAEPGQAGPRVGPGTGDRPVVQRGTGSGERRGEREHRQRGQRHGEAEQRQIGRLAQRVPPVATGRHGGHPFSPLVLMPSTSIRWKARKNRNTGSSDSTDMANIGPTALWLVESMNSVSATGTV